MNTYIYQTPLGKGSTKICKIKSTDGELVGSIQRYFKTPFRRMIDSILGRNNFFVNIKALDAEGSMIINAFRKNYWVKKSDNYIHFIGGDYKDKRFHAIQTSNIVIAPEFSIKNNDVEIISKTDAFDWVRFYEEGQEIARWRSRAKERYKTYIKIEKSASVQNPLFYATLGQMLYFIGP